MMTISAAGTDGCVVRGKRAFDVVAAVMMLIAFAPLMLLIAAAVTMTDRGPVLFAHERVGRHGRRFRCLKFRTMVRDADAALARLLVEDEDARREWAAASKLRRDPRVIRGVGRLLRASSLDELPQLINVLRGEMSVVGPRPVVAEELDRYGPFRAHYLSVRPGLTGPWQTGGRSDTTYTERVALDARYVEEATLATDFAIVARTATMLLTCRLTGAR